MRCILEDLGNKWVYHKINCLSENKYIYHKTNMIIKG